MNTPGASNSLPSGPFNCFLIGRKEFFNKTEEFLNEKRIFGQSLQISSDFPIFDTIKRSDDFSLSNTSWIQWFLFNSGSSLGIQ